MILYRIVEVTSDYHEESDSWSDYDTYRGLYVTVENALRVMHELEKSQPSFYKIEVIETDDPYEEVEN